MTLVKLNNRNARSIDPWVNGFFDSFFNEPAVFPQVADSRPSVNITENEDTFEIEMAAPGLKKEDFKINFENSLLTISADKKEEKTEEGKQYNKREFSFKTFSRSFTLPEQADDESISAEYIDGILKVSILKKEEEKPRLIEVK